MQDDCLRTISFLKSWNVLLTFNKDNYNNTVQSKDVSSSFHKESDRRHNENTARIVPILLQFFLTWHDDNRSAMRSE